MKIIHILLVVCVCFIINTKGFSQYFPVDTAQLNRTYSELIADPSSLSKQENFLKAFPSTFEEFMMTYQFWPGKDYDLTMYFKGSDHVYNGLAKLNLIPDSTYFDKLIWLCLNGRFYPDGPNYLKSVVRKKVRANQDVFFSRLNKFIDSQIISFWYFYFNSRFEKDYVSEYKEYKKMADKFPQVVKAMEIAYPASCGKAWN